MYILKNKFYIFVISIFDFLGYLLSWPFKLIKKTPLANDLKKILIIRLDNIGDVIFAIPIPKNLKNKYKNTKITFLVSSTAKDLVASNPFIDEIIYFDAPWFNQKNKGIISFGQVFKLIKHIKSYNFDLGIDLRGDLKHILIMALAGVRYKIGYGITGGGFLLEKAIKYRKNVHAIEHNLDILRNLNINTVCTKPEIFTKDLDRIEAAAILKQNGIFENDCFVVIHSCANYPSKNWRDEYWAKLMSSMAKIYNAKIVIIGSSKDLDSICRLKNACDVKFIDLSGKTSLSVLFEICKKAKFFIGIDSGPSHIAATSSIPTIVLFSGTNYAKEWSPLGDRVYTIEKDIDCKNCQKLNCRDSKCMSSISVEEVLDIIKKIKE